MARRYWTARTAWVSWVGKPAVGARAVKTMNRRWKTFDRGWERTVVQHGDTDVFVLLLQFVLDMLPEAHCKVSQG